MTLRQGDKFLEDRGFIHRARVGIDPLGRRSISRRGAHLGWRVLSQTILVHAASWMLLRTAGVSLPEISGKITFSSLDSV